LVADFDLSIPTFAGATKRMNKTLNSSVPHARREAVGRLNHTVAELFDLYVRIKRVCWNVRGVSFLDLHRFLDEFARRTLDDLDAAAELALALGGTVEGARRESARLPPPGEKEPSLTAGISSWLQELATINSIYSKHVHAAVRSMKDAGELGAADLLMAIARDLDQQFWMLEAHIERQ
jgi:starvation-inducible DNA-binding protein